MKKRKKDKKVVATLSVELPITLIESLKEKAMQEDCFLVEIVENLLRNGLKNYVVMHEKQASQQE